MKKFYCEFVNGKGERRGLISTLDPGEIAIVERVRSAEGDEIAQVTAAAIVLKSAYADLDPEQWHHLGPPTLVN